MKTKKGGLKRVIKKSQVFFFFFWTIAGDGDNDFVTNNFNVYIFYLMLLDIYNLL